MKIREFLFVILCLCLFLPVAVMAGGGGDDVTYTATFDDNYEYGVVKACSLTIGTYYQKGIESVSGKSICLALDNPDEPRKGLTTKKFKCSDSSMEQFFISGIKGSDGENYVGLGCRKIKDISKIDYIAKEAYVGYGEQLGKSIGYTCTIIEGDSIKLNDTCWYEGIKTGETKVKMVNNSSQKVEYFKINIKQGYQSISELDNKYYYGNIKKCDLISGSAYVNKAVPFDGHIFCGSISNEYNYEARELICEDSSYETFKLVFDSGGKHYKGYGCRKIKDISKIDYIDKEAYVGYGEQLGAWTGYTCTIIEGDSIKLNDTCWYEGIKTGETKVKVVNNSNQKVEYFKINIKQGYQSISELDDKYYYGNISVCKLGAKGYTYGDKVAFDGHTFCGSALPGYAYETYEVSCENDKYEKFKLVFDSGGKHYKGYGCRILKSNISEAMDLNYYIDGFYENDYAIKCKNINSAECKKFILKNYKNIPKLVKGCQDVYSNLSIDVSDASYKSCVSFDEKVKWLSSNSFFGNYVIGDKNSGDGDCEGVLGSLGDVLSRIYNILKLAVPVIIVAMGFKDFIQGMSSGKDDALKKAGTTFIKRLVVGAVFIMLPLLVKMILTFAFGGGFSDICISL